MKRLETEVKASSSIDNAVDVSGIILCNIGYRDDDDELMMMVLVNHIPFYTYLQSI